MTSCIFDDEAAWTFRLTAAKGDEHVLLFWRNLFSSAAEKDVSRGKHNNFLTLSECAGCAGSYSKKTEALQKY